MIKAIYSAVITNDAIRIVRTYTDSYGFLISHMIENPMGDGTKIYVLENEFGQRFDVIEIKDFGNDCIAARINVDDFKSSIKMYTDCGFKVIVGPVETDSNEYAIIERNNESYICLMEHKS